MYAIAFDFPEDIGRPWFAARLRDGLGITTDLSAALRFDDEDAAERMLENGYGTETRSFGVVVEVSE